MKNNYEFNIIEQLDDDDKHKIRYFIQLLMRQEKYNKLKEEIRSRRKEVAQGDIFSHDDIWSHLDV